MLSDQINQVDDSNCVIVRFTNGPNTFAYDIVEEHHHQYALNEICGHFSKDRRELCIEAYLVPQQIDASDWDGVAVIIEDKIVGHLPKKDVEIFRKKHREVAPPNAIICVDSKIVGGWYSGCGNIGHFSVKLDLTWN